MLIDNIRYSIGNVVEDKYGAYNDKNLEKLAIEMNLPFEELYILVNYGAIREKNFNKLCAYLKPDSDLEKYWKEHYVIEDDMTIGFGKNLKEIIDNILEEELDFITREKRNMISSRIQKEIQIDNVKSNPPLKDEHSKISANFDEYAALVYPYIEKCIEEDEIPLTSRETTKELLKYMIITKKITEDKGKKYMKKWKLN